MWGQVQATRRAILQHLGSWAGVAAASLMIQGCQSTSAQAVLTLEIACDGNNLAFAPMALTAPAGQPVQVIFRNVSTIFSHNWVLVAGGADVADQVNLAATTAGPDRDYIPAETSQIIAHTPLIPRGESDTVTFTTPAAGEYVYLCTFPGHYLAGMRGTFVTTA